jgi:hypothetical protein
MKGNPQSPPLAGQPPLALVAAQLSDEDRELLSYFHALAHEARPSALLLMRHAAINRPLAQSVEGAPPRAPGIRLAVVNGAKTR